MRWVTENSYDVLKDMIETSKLGKGNYRTHTREKSRKEDPMDIEKKYFIEKNTEIEGQISLDCGKIGELKGKTSTTEKKGMIEESLESGNSKVTTSTSLKKKSGYIKEKEEKRKGKREEDPKKTIEREGRILIKIRMRRSYLTPSQQ